jgi:hypothetical protein
VIVALGALLGPEESGGRNMRKLIVRLMMLVGCTFAGSAASTALAAPNPDHASCEAILTSPDAHIGIRDDVAREFAAADFPPGDIYSLAARATGTTEEECEASIGS